MTYSVTDHENVTVIAPEGRLVAACVEEIRNLAGEQLAKRPNILFDLSKMSHVDSSGLGVLVQLLQRACEKGGTVKLACLQPHPKIVFDITKVYRVFEIFDTVDAALKSFGE